MPPPRGHHPPDPSRLDARRDTTNAAITAWHFATGAFEGEESNVELDGDVRSVLLGADAEWERMLAGDPRVQVHRRWFVPDHWRGNGPWHRRELSFEEFDAFTAAGYLLDAGLMLHLGSTVLDLREEFPAEVSLDWAFGDIVPIKLVATVPEQVESTALTAGAGEIKVDWTKPIAARGYGFAVPHTTGLVTPYTGLSLGDDTPAVPRRNAVARHIRRLDRNRKGPAPGAPARQRRTR